MLSSPSLRRPVCAAAADGDSGQGRLKAVASILLAEDDLAVRTLLCRVLRLHGFAVDEAKDGADALAMAEAAPFDLLITDVLMPRLGGLELVGRLREQGFRGPVIYITGYAEALIAAAEADLVLRKPFAPSTLLEAVSRALT
jgi:CheY-like chemotaxis protein